MLGKVNIIITIFVVRTCSLGISVWWEKVPGKWEEIKKAGNKGKSQPRPGSSVGRSLAFKSDGPRVNS
jgi:hypothetical protein